MLMIQPKPTVVVIAFLCEIKKQDRMFIHLPFLLLHPHLHRSNEDEEEKAKVPPVDGATSLSWAEPVQA